MKKNTNRIIIISQSLTNSYNNELTYFVKDNFWSRDFPTTASSNFLIDFRTQYNATVIKILTEKGYRLLGKTVLDEFACGGTGLNASTGPVFNPYNDDHLVGGSSSGSALVVAKKLSPFALGSDTGGSIRHPAAYCGLVGFKSSYRAISLFGLIPMASSLDTVGILTNSVSMAKKVYSLIAQPDPADLLTIVYWSKTFPTCPPPIITKKIAIIKDIEQYLPSSYIKLYHQIISHLKKDNYQIENIEIPSIIRDNLQFGWLVNCLTELISHLNSLQGITYGNKDNSSVAVKRSKFLGSIVRQRLLIGAYLLENKEILERVYTWREKVNEWSRKVFRKYNFLIFPSANSEAPRINQSSFLALGSKNHWSENLLVLANLAGFPSLSLPIGMVNGLPVSININSNKGNDEKILDLAEFLSNTIIN